MIVYSDPCICDQCMRDNVCGIQRSIINLQRIAGDLEPEEAWVAIYMKKCPAQVEREDTMG